MTTKELDNRIGLFLGNKPAVSYLSTLYNYNSHISTGKILCHGIPSEREVIQSNSTVHVDIPLIINNLISDASWTFLSGSQCPELVDLINFSWSLSHSLIDYIKEGMPVSKVAEFCMKKIIFSSYHIFNEGLGHGTGYSLHEEPYISYTSKTGRSEVFHEGLVFTVEPVVLLNKKVSCHQNKDEEIVFNEVNSISCFEFTAAIINGKCKQISFGENNFKKSIDSPSYF